MKKLDENIWYIEATEKPISCDVIFIKTDKATWIFDVGRTKESADSINAIEGPKNVVISHFHPDHILNLKRIKYDNLYVSKYTKRYTFKGTVFEGAKTFDDDPSIFVQEFPSSHAKGCLILVCNDYAFLGDGTYVHPTLGKQVYNAQKLQQMIECMEKIDAKYFCMSHDPNFVQTKEEVINLYKGIYSRHRPNNPIIDVSDFFNDDGSVKRDM